MELSIIIPSYDTKALLDRCLISIYKSLKDTTIDFEVIVVDNASTDDTRELLNNKYPRVKKILNKANVGYGKANNQGILKARGEYIFLLNSDIIVQDRAIEKLLTFCKVHPRSFVGGKLLNKDLSPQASCGPMYTLPIVFTMLFLKGDVLHVTRYSPDTEKTVDWVSGACLMGPKAGFLDIGLFDENIFMYMEEIDFLHRSFKRGYRTYFYPQAQFIHTGAASSGSRKDPVGNIYRGLLYYYQKHHSIMEQQTLRHMLQWKARIAIGIATIIGNKTLHETYEHALSMV